MSGSGSPPKQSGTSANHFCVMLELLCRILAIDPEDRDSTDDDEDGESVEDFMERMSKETDEIRKRNGGHLYSYWGKGNRNHKKVEIEFDVDAITKEVEAKEKAAALRKQRREAAAALQKDDGAGAGAGAGAGDGANDGAGAGAGDGAGAGEKSDYSSNVEDSMEYFVRRPVTAGRMAFWEARQQTEHYNLASTWQVLQPVAVKPAAAKPAAAKKAPVKSQCARSTPSSPQVGTSTARPTRSSKMLAKATRRIYRRMQKEEIMFDFLAAHLDAVLLSGLASCSLPTRYPKRAVNLF